MGLKIIPVLGIYVPERTKICLSSLWKVSLSRDTTGV